MLFIREDIILLTHIILHVGGPIKLHPGADGVLKVVITSTIVFECFMYNASTVHGQVKRAVVNKDIHYYWTLLFLFKHFSFGGVCINFNFSLIIQYIFANNELTL